MEENMTAGVCSKIGHRRILSLPHMSCSVFSFSDTPYCLSSELYGRNTVLVVTTAVLCKLFMLRGGALKIRALTPPGTPVL